MDIISLIKQLDTDWKDVLLPIAEKYKTQINDTLLADEAKFRDVLEIVPHKENILKAFNKFNVREFKVCILGQDPYLSNAEAMGICFSVPNGVKCPPSLRNVFKELEHEYGKSRTQTDLTDWCEQGVLMLNTALTTLEGKSAYHVKIWKGFMNEVIQYIGQNLQDKVYVLWGAHAQSFKPLLNINTNYVLTHSHPSPLSRQPFVGNNHFKMCNEYLVSKNIAPICWI